MKNSSHNIVDSKFSMTLYKLLWYWWWIVKKFIEWTRKIVRVSNIKIWQFRQLIKIISKLYNDVKTTLIFLTRNKSQILIDWSRVCFNDLVDSQKIFEISIRLSLVSSRRVKLIFYRRIIVKNKIINKIINRKITIIKIFKINQKCIIIRKKKNYDIIVNENKNYQKDYYNELKYQNIIVNETKFVYNESTKYNEKTYNYFVKTSIKIYIYRRYSIEFYFNNNLHKHVEFCKNLLSIKNNLNKIINEFHVFVIQFNVTSNKLIVESNFDFTFWTRLDFRFQLLKSTRKIDFNFCTRLETRLDFESSFRNRLESSKNRKF